MLPGNQRTIRDGLGGDRLLVGYRGHNNKSCPHPRIILRGGKGDQKGDHKVTHDSVRMFLKSACVINACGYMLPYGRHSAPDIF